MAPFHRKHMVKSSGIDGTVTAVTLSKGRACPVVGVTSGYRQSAVASCANHEAFNFDGCFLPRPCVVVTGHTVLELSRVKQNLH